MLEECSLKMLNDIPSPWNDAALEPADWVRGQVPYDAMACGVLSKRYPREDELFVAEGWDHDDLRNWCRSGHRDDPLFEAAANKGLAVFNRNGSPSSSSLVGNRHAVVLTLPETVGEERCWWMLLVREDKPFTELEQRTAGIILRKWQCSFNQFPEPGMGRMIIGHDDRLIVADLGTQARLLHAPDLIHSLIASLRPVIDQRYPGLDDRTERDVALPIDGDHQWVCFRRSRVIDDDRSEHWFIELRRLDQEDLPPVGAVKDERIASAIAFLHDNYPQSPSLADVARHVHMSPFHFHRLFTRQVGVSPKQYLQRRQLQVAKWLLRSTRQPIGEIASQTGFSSHGHFTSTFHRIVGVSPSDYRERH